MTVEVVKAGETTISFVKPTEMLSLGRNCENEEIAELADDVKKR